MSTLIRESAPLAFDAEHSIATRPPALARRVIVDEHRAVSAYQLVPATRALQHPGAALSPESIGNAQDPESRLTKPTFVRCTCQDLVEGELDWLDPHSVVLDIHEDASLARDGSSLDLAVLQAARAKGFKLAFDARLLKKEYAAFVPLASYVILEMGVLELDRAAAVARAVQSGTKAMALASRVRTAAEYEHLASAGVKLFEGIWFTQPPAKADNAIKLSYASLINLLNMVMREAEVAEIEDLLRREPTLSFKLLRYINSCGFGRHIEIASFRHAVMTVGMKRLFRWTALLIAGTPAGNVAPAAGTLAIVRGRLMELLALEALSPVEADLAFVTGMFSMLDVLLAMPLADALALVTLPPSVGDAVLRNEGMFARYLEIARACESADEGLLQVVSQRHGVSCDRMISVHLEALAWAEQFGN